MQSKKDTIRAKAIELLKNNPDGLRYSELQQKLLEFFPTKKTVAGSIWDLDITHGNEISKPARGLFKYKQTEEKEEKAEQEQIEQAKIKEEYFYKPFAE